jgi:hypothetical protein
MIPGLLQHVAKRKTTVAAKSATDANGSNKTGWGFQRLMTVGNATKK